MTLAWSSQTSYIYTAQARELFDRHRLIVPDKTTEMIAKTIARSYRLASIKNKGPSPRTRIRKALAHAEKLLEYTERDTKSRRLAASVSNRSASLTRILNDFGVAVWLATATPPIDVVAVLEQLEGDGLPKGELTRLIPALKSALPAKGKPGRPREDMAHVLRGACIAWRRAGRPEKCTWDPLSGEHGTVKGPLAAFARDLLDRCQLAAQSENALYCALRLELHRIR
jgi:hypothetical protein